jgi:hypothetical protein
MLRNGTASKGYAGSISRVSVRARGDRCGTTPPRMVVKVDGRTVASPRVRATRWTYYSANISRPSGAHRVSISYVNDVNSRRCSRDLHLDKVSITPAPAPVPAPAPGSIALGAAVGGYPDYPLNAKPLDDFSVMIGRRPSFVTWYQDWSGGFVREHFDATAARGVTPMVTWEPRHSPTDPNDTKRNYTLAKIVAGNHDAYIRQYARDARAWGKPIYLRFAHEMNGNWYPWSSGVNGNTSAEYVAAWRHVHDIFRQEGATNVKWVWAPNVSYPGTTPYAQLYPGDAYVDWVGLDGYNWGATSTSSWTSFYNIFGSSYAEMAALTSKPMMIAETASAEQGGDKAAWIRQGLLTDVPSRFPRVGAVLWFNVNLERDWRVNSSSASLTAFREVAASSRYQGKLP